MELVDVREGMTVRLLGPEGHGLHGHTGIVGRVMSPEWLWANEPMTMLGDPFAWVTGQVLVSLSRPPEGTPGRWRTPLVVVRPEDIELG